MEYVGVERAGLDDLDGDTHSLQYLQRSATWLKPLKPLYRTRVLAQAVENGLCQCWGTRSKIKKIAGKDAARLCPNRDKMGQKMLNTLTT